jgi:uncharacterized protein YidB (DUF937 family)
MSKSTPSLLALLGLVAVAGYQNRSKISDMLSDARKSLPAQDPTDPSDNGVGIGAGTSPLGGFISEARRLFEGGVNGGSLTGGLSDLVERFQSTGHSEPAESWVSNGPNMPVGVEDLRTVLGEDTLHDLSAKTGMTPEQVLLRLNAALPDVVNQLTPSGRIPTQSEAAALA